METWILIAVLIGTQHPVQVEFVGRKACEDALHELLPITTTRYPNDTSLPGAGNTPVKVSMCVAKGKPTERTPAK